MGPFFNSEVVVIGGGATGAGITRDLTNRGIRVVLVERKDISAGATGRCHGLLHSGVRYAVGDIQAAQECIRENRILKRVAAETIEKTEGLMIFLKGDDPEYLEQWIENTGKAGIEADEIPVSRALEMEPGLSADTERVFIVPDASVDPFLLTLENVRSAVHRGATVLRHAPVVGFETRSGKVGAVKVRYQGEILTIGCETAVIAAGAWSDEVARMAGVKVPMNLSKGSLVIMNHRLSQRVLNHCRRPSDADLIIPNGPTSIVGTTSVAVSSPDDSSVSPEEVAGLIKGAAAMVPAFERSRPIRSYAGVRPLYQDVSAGGGGRSLSRGFFVLDHEKRDGLGGLVSVVGGKLTTYRLMAEKTSDLVCQKLGVNRSGQTHEEPLLENRARNFATLGEKIGNLEKAEEAENPVVCDCEMVTQNEILEAYHEIEGEMNLADIQHRTRMGMGTCQGGLCALRTVGLLAGRQDVSFPEADQALRVFLSERWKGIYPLLWGEQLREEYLNYGIYAALFNLDKTGGPE